MEKLGSAPAEVQGVLECRAPDGTLRWSIPFAGAVTHQEKQNGNHARDRAAERDR
jgi:hypothetical protein